MKKIIQKHRRESGFTLVETVIALGVLLLVGAAVVPRFRMIERSMNRMSARQNAATLESELRSVLSDERNMKYSATKSGNSAIQSCIVDKKNCTHKATYPISVYAVGQTKPIAGPDVFYKRSGERCYTAGCGPISVTTEIAFFCTKGASPCSPYNAVATKFAIRDSESKEAKKNDSDLLSSDAVEMQQNTDQLSSTLYLSCPKGQVLRGIGLNGGPACIAIKDIKYQDAENRNNGKFTVKRETCFGKVKVQKPKQGGAEGEMEEVEEDDRSDKKYVEGIDKNGSLKCKEKTW